MPRKIVARKSAIHGNGVFALLPIAKGERVIEYKGKRRTHAEFERARAHYDRLGLPNRVEFIAHNQGHISATARAMDFLIEQL